MTSQVYHPDMTSKAFHPNMISIFEDEDPTKPPSISNSIELELKPGTPSDYSEYYEIDTPIEYVSVVSSFIRDFEYQKTIKEQGFSMAKNKRMKVDLVMLDTLEDKLSAPPTMSLNQAYLKIGGFGRF